MHEVLFYLRENPFVTLETTIEISGLLKFKAEHLQSDLILLEVIKLEIGESSEKYKLTPTDSDSS